MSVIVSAAPEGPDSPAFELSHLDASAGLLGLI